MLNTSKFKALLVEKGLILKNLQPVLGISLNSISKKVNNKVEFKLSEIQKLCTYLQITDVYSIFFEKFVDKNLHKEN
jgi:DNA-binding Xre family transcriptional regulator